jgi:hypothetical protein
MRGSPRESSDSEFAEAPPHPEFGLRPTSGLSPQAGRGEEGTIAV